MPKKRFSAEQIVTLLRQIEVSMAQGKSTPEACRAAEISQQSYYRWRKEYGGLESILGFVVAGNTLHLDPCIPRAWQDFEIVYRHKTARYEIQVENPAGVCRGVAHVKLDGQALSDGSTNVPLIDDGTTHHVRVTLG